MKIINEYLIVDSVTGEVDKYVELEGEVFFKVSLVKYYWISSDEFYERYDITKKTFEIWKTTKK
jgi:hypothetical protein